MSNMEDIIIKINDNLSSINEKLNNFEKKINNIELYLKNIPDKNVNDNKSKKKIEKKEQKNKKNFDYIDLERFNIIDDDLCKILEIDLNDKLSRYLFKLKILNYLNLDLKNLKKIEITEKNINELKINKIMKNKEIISIIELEKIINFMVENFSK